MSSEYVVTLPITVPVDDTSRDLLPGEIVTADDLPSGSLTSMLRLRQIIPADEAQHDLDHELGLPPTIVGKLSEAGLTTRDEIVAYAKAHDGFGELLTEKQSQKVFDALKATEPKA